MKKVLWVKFGWSAYYRGGPVDGNFGWLKENGEKNGGRGHEAFNFKPSQDGTYYCYVPPQGKGAAPSSDDPHGWTVICLAKHPDRTGIYVVGWYENATLYGKWFAPPADFIPQRGDTDRAGYDWSYCISSRTAYFIPPESRRLPFSDPAVRTGKYSYLEGPDIETNESRQRVLALLEGRIDALRPFVVRNPDENSLPDPELDPVDPLKGFGTPEHRKAVEKAAEDAVIAHYQSDGFACERVTHLPCGYDFVFSKKGKKLHVEVKGTASSNPQFFLTRNEYREGMLSNPRWRLAMVTNALRAPEIAVYARNELNDTFDLDPYVYRGTFAPKVAE
ncbi:hypothetical protein PIN31009_04674 [Pandoraea iniqua]|uniref:DUF3883 domain-containing protein n=1 Tax=Pandoraea iniqua TaxID=2508288 RepID=UPI00124207B3|nr:DUF3883 domain-containing protein [Pandoraea iniqua]VVE51334.1 hypothetical protein PIN31009_04674 [Pandoraea iniqua]